MYLLWWIFLYFLEVQYCVQITAICTHWVSIVLLLCPPIYWPDYSLAALGNIPMMDDLLLAFQSNNHQGSGPYFEGYCGEHQQHYPGLEQLSGLDAGGGFLCYIERFKCWFVLTSWIIPSLWMCPPSTAWTPWRDEQQPWKHAPCSALVNCLYSSSRPQCCCRTLYYLCHEREYGVTLSEGGRPTHAHASRRRHFPL